MQWVGWHHWLNRHEFEPTLGDNGGQRSLVCCSPWGLQRVERNLATEPPPPLVGLFYLIHRANECFITAPGLKQLCFFKSDFYHRKRRTCLEWIIIIISIPLYFGHKKKKAWRSTFSSNFTQSKTISFSKYPLGRYILSSIKINYILY